MVCRDSRFTTKPTSTGAGPASSTFAHCFGKTAGQTPARTYREAHTRSNPCVQGLRLRWRWKDSLWAAGPCDEARRQQALAAMQARPVVEAAYLRAQANLSRHK